MSEGSKVYPVVSSEFYESVRMYLFVDCHILIVYHTLYYMYSGDSQIRR